MSSVSKCSFCSLIFSIQFHSFVCCLIVTKRLLHLQHYLSIFRIPSRTKKQEGRKGAVVILVKQKLFHKSLTDVFLHVIGLIYVIVAILETRKSAK